MTILDEVYLQIEAKRRLVAFLVIIIVLLSLAITCVSVANKYPFVPTLTPRQTDRNVSRDA